MFSPPRRCRALPRYCAGLEPKSCLYLLQRPKTREAHMQASVIFISHDVIIDLGVITAGVLVLWLGSGIPNLVSLPPCLWL